MLIKLEYNDRAQYPDLIDDTQEDDDELDDDIMPKFGSIK